MVDKEPEWVCYKDPLQGDGKLLMGYKGTSVLDAGYFYAPYIPITQTPVVLDPSTFQPTKGIITRYGKRLLEGQQPEAVQPTKQKVHRSITDEWEVSRFD